MAEDIQRHFTKVLRQLSANSPEGADDLLPMVYEQLRAIAQRRMNNQRDNHTLQATALVHEAYVRLVGRQDIQWQDRVHFFFAAARAMQDILIEHARSKARLKRGGDGHRPGKHVPLNVADLAADVGSDEILALTDAVRRLELEQPKVAEIVRLRFYAGLTSEQTAAVLNISDRQVRRVWSYGRAWLYRQLQSQQQ